MPVTVFDRSGFVTDLSVQATNIKFDVIYDDETTLYDNQSATATLMVVNCLIDLSATGPDGYLEVPEPPGYIRLRLFVEFTIGAESPRLGPVIIYVKEEL